MREIEAIGGNVSSSVSREHVSYTYDALKSYIPQMVELLIDSVRNPAFLDWEVSEQVYIFFLFLENIIRFSWFFDFAVRFR